MICFGGSSQVNNVSNQKCQFGGKFYDDATTVAEKPWYSVGGFSAFLPHDGGPTCDPTLTWWTQQHVDNLNAMIGKNCSVGNCLTSDHYKGIFYDIELIHDITNLDFETSFKKAKAAGLKVMFSTSYTFPIQDENQAAGWPRSLVPTIQSILSSEHVDIVAPQFYGDGFVPTGGAKGVCTGGVCDFAFWKRHLRADTQVMPIFKSFANGATGPPTQAGITADFNRQVDAIKAQCSSDPDFKLFCRNNMFYLWNGN